MTIEVFLVTPENMGMASQDQSGSRFDEALAARSKFGLRIGGQRDTSMNEANNVVMLALGFSDKSG